MSDFLVEFFSLLSQDFFQRALIVGSLLAINFTGVGFFMIFKRYSGVADGISHIALFGFVLGIVLNFYPLVLTLVVSLIGAILIEFVRQKKIMNPETAISLVVAISLAIVAILQSKVNLRVNLESILFGNILVISDSNLLLFVIISLLTIFLILKKYKTFMNLVISEELASASGIKVAFWNYILVIQAALIVALGVNMFGALLVSGMLILPTITALQFGFGFKKSHFLGVIFSLFSVWIGLIFSWLLGLSPSSSIILTGFLMLILSLLIKKI
jgi:zinc transport system permease protein